MRLRWTRDGMKHKGVFAVANSQNNTFRIVRGVDNGYELQLNGELVMKSGTIDFLKQQAEEMT